jgi:hypothetical protein
MFKVVASFTRANADYEFFNDIYMDNDIVKELHRQAEELSGYLGIDENIYRDQFRCDKAMCFDSEQAFYEFAVHCKTILDKRMEIINEYCLRTGHEYKYYMIKD